MTPNPHRFKGTPLFGYLRNSTG